MVTVEDVQKMMTALQEQNNENMRTLARQQMEALTQIVANSKPNGIMTDTRAIGKPITFKGEELKYPEWKAKLMAYLKMTVPDSENWIRWAAEEKDPITEERMDEAWLASSRQAKEFAGKLYAMLLSCTEDDAFRICHSVSTGNGLEAMRLLTRRFEPRTPGTKRALLKAIINNQPAKKVQDIEANLMHVEELMRKYESLAKEVLPEDLKVTVIIDLTIKDLKEHMELSTKDMKYKEVRDEIMSYVERKRETFGNQLKAMEVDSHEKQAYWGGGDWPTEDYYGDMSEHYKDEGTMEMNNFHNYKGGGKGKGGKGGKGGKRISALATLCST